MNDKEYAQEFVDLIAESIQLFIDVSEEKLCVLRAHIMYDTSYNTIKTVIDKTKETGVRSFLDEIKRVLNHARTLEEDQKQLQGMLLCRCMDEVVTYESQENVWENGKFSLFSLVTLESDLRPQIIQEMNSNKEKIGLCIAPRFLVSTAIIRNDEEEITRNLYSRDALYGINGSLNNISYYQWDESVPVVHHVVLTERYLSEDDIALDATTVAFTPISDKQDLLNFSEPFAQKIYETSCNVVSVVGLQDAEHIEKNFKKSWMEACKHSVDIFFAPEMLATKKMIEIEDGGSVFLEALLMQAMIEGYYPPRLTIMPTYWKDGRNIAYVFDEMGRLCGMQQKRFPFINVKEKWVENIRVDEQPDVLMIHLKNRQRVAIAICAEFLERDYASQFLCEKLGATLILVPAYSLGEQDFINALSSLKPYGTSVIWGNCCGAAYRNQNNRSRIIGGVSYAGIDSISRLGGVCNCDFECKDREGCTFLIEIPRKVVQNKPMSSEAPRILHLDP